MNGGLPGACCRRDPMPKVGVLTIRSQLSVPAQARMKVSVKRPSLPIREGLEFLGNVSDWEGTEALKVA